MNFLEWTLAIGAGLAQPGPKSASQPAAILITGQWHAEEVSKSSAGSWLALELGPSRAFLERTEAKLSPCEDAITGSGTKVQCTSKANILLRGVRKDSVRLGARLELTMARMTRQQNGASSSIPEQGRWAGEFEGTKVEIWSEALVSQDAPEERHPWVLRLKVGDRVQSILRSTMCDECSWEPIFVGDLDGDGKPDLIMQASDHYNVSIHRLYLSSAAEGREMVRQVATFRTTGC